MDKTNEEQKKHWLSLDEWRQDPEFKDLAEQEFLSSPISEETQSGWARRDFLKLMGASLALGSFGCVRRPAQTIVPYVNRPEGMVPGVSNYYASTYQDGGEVLGMVVKTREGRPIKLEGNEFYPEIGEALNLKAQASLLSVYDPDRLTAPIQNLVNPEKTNKDTIATNWDKADEDVQKNLERGGVYVLSDSNPSKTSRGVINEFVAKYTGKYYEWSPVSYEAFKKSFKSLGNESDSLPRYRLSKSNYVLSIGTDFLGSAYGSLQLEREWGPRRDVSLGEPLKLVQAEALMSLTGTNADDRVILKASDYLSFLCAVISYMGVSGGYASKASGYAGVKHLSDKVKAQAKQVAASLKANAGKSIVMGFGVDARNADYNEIQKAVHYLNSKLGNDGKTIDYSQAPYVSYRASSSSIESLIADMNAGKVKTLVLHDTNPVYTYSDSKAFVKALKKVKLVIYTGAYNDETGSVSNYVLPDHNALEKWNEFEGLKGVYSVAQPTISPLHDTRGFEESLLKWMGSSETWYDRLQKTWKERFEANKASSGFSKFEDFWVELLQKGVWDLSEFKNSAKSARLFSGDFNASKYIKTDDLELAVYPSLKLGTGKYANVSWLQECPDPVTKVAWDNFLSVSMNYAQKHKLKDEDVVVVKSGGVSMELPVLIQPGQDSSTVGVELGYGRKGAGKVADGVGKNASLLLKGLAEVEVKKTNKTYKLANTQGHFRMEGRQIVAEASYNEFKEKGSAGIHKHKVISLWSKHKYTGHKWAMSVDLSKCTGCSACVVACQSENNIPVVGKKFLLQGREMHWIRIDRYYSGSPEAPRVLHQPVMCMHCDNAPCETVCPVLATTHSSEGLNDMTYNRCVGTRYCANNCPYKVRRFNWFNYSKVEAPLNMAMNPDVTVRSRGVMEKCSFCVQKINEGKSQAVLENRKLKDGDIVPACEQTCATKALVFGDMNDPESRVSKAFKEQRTYELLEEINVVPAVRYMTKIWNTEEEIAGHGHHHGSEKDQKKEHKEDKGHGKKESQHQGEAHS